jgi:hypothetical protein
LINIVGRRGLVLGREPGLEPLERQWPAEQEALADVAPELLEQGDGELALHPLSHHDETEVAGQVHHGPHDREIAGVGDHALDERAVDLDFVDR